MTERRSTRDADVPETLEGCMSQIEEVERRSTEVLEVIAGVSASPDFVNKVLRLGDTLQAAARKADLGFGRATAQIPGRSGGITSFQDRRQHAKEALASRQRATGASTLPEVLDSVRDISGLEVVCVSYPSWACELAGVMTAAQGVDPEAATEVWLVIPRVMRAAVGLENKGVPTPVTVAVFGPNEAGPGKNAWATSEYLVFQRIAAVALRTLKHYLDLRKQDPDSGGKALRDLLLWLCSYRDLFSRPCDALKTMLVADSSSRHMVPPLFRPYRQSWDELLDAASGRRSVAYHMAAAPASVL